MRHFQRQQEHQQHQQHPHTHTRQSRRPKTVAFSDECSLIPAAYVAQRQPSTSPSSTRRKPQPQPQPQPSTSSSATSAHRAGRTLRDHLAKSLAAPGGLPSSSASTSRTDTQPWLRDRASHRAAWDLQCRCDALEAPTMRGKRSWSSSDLRLLCLPAGLDADTDWDDDQHPTRNSLQRRARPTLDANARVASPASALPASPIFTGPPPLSPAMCTPTLASTATASPPPVPGKSGFPFAAPVAAPVAAPKAAYRPLRLGSADSDEEDGPEDLSQQSQPPAPPPPLVASSHAPTTARNRSEGPPVIASSLAKVLFGVPSLSARLSSPYARGRGYRSTPDLRGDVASSSSSSPPPPLHLSQPHKATDHTGPVDPVAPASAHKRKPSWLKRQARRISRDAVGFGSSSSSEQPATRDDASEASTEACSDEAVEVVPLISECVCAHCSGRINAGLSLNYAPHWSKGARSKWLADRKQAELTAAQGIDASQILQARAQGTSPATDRPLPGYNPMRYNRSPPPPGYGMGAAAAPPLSFGSLGSEAHRATPSPALLEALAEPTADAEAGLDLQRILSGESDHSTSSLQVDEVDQKRGEASYPAAGPQSPLEDASADSHLFHSALARTISPAPNQADKVRRSTSTPTPVGEVNDMDAALASEVEAEVALRRERQRAEQAKRRGGARGMLAQLEEAEAVEKRAQAQREARRSIDARGGGGAGERGPGTYTPPLPSPSPSPFRPPSRTSSPLLDRIKSAVSSSHHAAANQAPHSNHLAPNAVPPLRGPSPLGRRSIDGERNSSAASNSANASQRPTHRTPSPFVPSPTIAEEGQGHTGSHGRGATFSATSTPPDRSISPATLASADRLPKQRTKPSAAGGGAGLHNGIGVLGNHGHRAHSGGGGASSTSGGSAGGGLGLGLGGALRAAVGLNSSGGAPAVPGTFGLAISPTSSRSNAPSAEMHLPPAKPSAPASTPATAPKPAKPLSRSQTIGPSGSGSGSGPSSGGALAESMRRSASVSKPTRQTSGSSGGPSSSPSASDTIRRSATVHDVSGSPGGRRRAGSGSAAGESASASASSRSASGTASGTATPTSGGASARLNGAAARLSLDQGRPSPAAAKALGMSNGAGVSPAGSGYATPRRAATSTGTAGGGGGGTASGSAREDPAEDAVEKRLKRRSLQKRLTAPMNVARGLFR